MRDLFYKWERNGKENWSAPFEKIPLTWSWFIEVATMGCWLLVSSTSYSLMREKNYYFVNRKLSEKIQNIYLQCYFKFFPLWIKRERISSRNDLCNNTWKGIWILLFLYIRIYHRWWFMMFANLSHSNELQKHPHCAMEIPPFNAVIATNPQKYFCSFDVY